MKNLDLHLDLKKSIKIIKKLGLDHDLKKYIDLKSLADILKNELGEIEKKW